MKRILISYLLLCGIFEAVLLLLASGTARENRARWNHFEPESILPLATEISPLIAKAGLIIPVAMALVAAGYWTNRIESPKVGIHVLGLSLMAAIVVAAWAIIASVLPAVGRILVVDENGDLVRPAGVAGLRPP